MNYLNKKCARVSVLAAVIAMALSPSLASAQNNYTPAGTSVENTFTLTYEVGAVEQPAITNDTPTQFTVDRLVDLNVTYQANSDDSVVAPGGSDEELVFMVRNDGNDSFAYSLSAFNDTTGTDEFDNDSFTIYYYVDAGVIGTFEPTVDTGPTLFSSVTPDVAPDSILWIEVRADIPVSEEDGNTARVNLTADSLYPTAWVTEGTTGGLAGDPITQDTGGNTQGSTAENVLADGAGPNDAANAGDFSAIGTFTVASPNLEAEKTVTVVSSNLAGDFNCLTGTQVSADEYAVSGACVEYVIEVINSGSTKADITAISDTLPGELTFIGAEFANFTAGTAAKPATNTNCVSNGCVVSQTGGSIASNVTATITIRALVK